MSSRRSRSGGSCTCDHREPVVEVLAEACPSLTSAREVAVGRRDDAHVDARVLALPPTRRTSRVSSDAQQLRLQRRAAARRSRRGTACRRRPPRRARARSPTAPVNAPRTWPKSSLSRRFSASAPQSTTTNGPSRARRRVVRSPRATSSLPVPVSPWMSTVASVGATPLEHGEQPRASPALAPIEVAEAMARRQLDRRLRLAGAARPAPSRRCASCAPAPARRRARARRRRRCRWCCRVEDAHRQPSTRAARSAAATPSDRSDRSGSLRGPDARSSRIEPNRLAHPALPRLAARYPDTPAATLARR